MFFLSFLPPLISLEALLPVGFFWVFFLAFSHFSRFYLTQSFPLFPFLLSLGMAKDSGIKKNSLATRTPTKMDSRPLIPAHSFLISRDMKEQDTFLP
jgi:hypothetical protein